MKTLRKQSLIALLLLNAASLAPRLAAEPRFVPPPPAAVETKNVSVGGQYYELSVGGLSSYMEELRRSDPKTHAKLAADLDSLRSRNTWAQVALYGGLVGGLALVSLGALKSPDPSIPMMATGVVLAAGGPIAGMILMPGRRDLLDFVNRHNRLRPSKPLQVSWDFQLVPQLSGGAVAGLTIGF